MALLMATMGTEAEIFVMVRPTGYTDQDPGNRIVQA
jgi:hypothetical protein